MHALKTALFLIGGLTAIGTSACQKQAPNAGQADVSQTAAAPQKPEPLTDPQDIASLICKYSRGSFPNWTLWEHFGEYLSPDERDAVQYVSERLLAQIPKRRQPKHIAISRFTAAHTVCRPAFESHAAVVTRETSGAISFKFTQEFPDIPNVAPPYGLASMSPEAQADAWLRAFERAEPQPHIYQRTVSVTVEPDEVGIYHVRSNILKSYAEPLQAQKFWQSLDLWRFEDAFEQMAVMCVQEHPDCDDMKAYFAATAAFRHDMSNRFARDVTITDVRQKLIAPGAVGSYTVIEMTLTNHGSHDYSGIVFATDEVERQYCELQSERTKREDRTLTLKAGETRTAWCALKRETPPWVTTEFWISG